MMPIETSLLARSKLFEGLDLASAERLAEHGELMRFEPRDIITREGAEATAIFCVLQGYVRLCKANADGRAIDIRICEPGDSFAECLVAGGFTYAYSAHAAGAVMVARFDLAEVKALAHMDRDISGALMRLMAGHLLDLMECIASDRLDTALQRVTNYLLSHCMLDQQHATIHLPFQKNLLAGKLGLTPEALSRAFATLKSAGVAVQGRTVRIGDIAALRRV